MQFMRFGGPGLQPGARTNYADLSKPDSYGGFEILFVSPGDRVPLENVKDPEQFLSAGLAEIVTEDGGPSKEVHDGLQSE